MNLAFYAPFKPLDHKKPSGDRTIGRGLAQYLGENGFNPLTVSRLRARWIYYRPWLWPGLALEMSRAASLARQCGIWLTYHNYYKSPDLLGPYCAARAGLPYVIFQASYSTKHAKHALTWPGYYLARRALLAARHVFANRLEDVKNLTRLLPADRVSYVAPGIVPQDFRHDPAARCELRAAAKLGQTPLILCAAMLRADVKSQGVEYLLRRLAELAAQGLDFRLWLAGDGEKRAELEALAAGLLPGRVSFLGLIERASLARYYSAADIFAFPGINESLGMVYLEAQAAGLPVVAFAEAGVPEVVEQGVSGYLSKAFDDAGFRDGLSKLLTNPELRREMGQKARDKVFNKHDLNLNYQVVIEVLKGLSHAKR